MGCHNGTFALVTLTAVRRKAHEVGVESVGGQTVNGVENGIGGMEHSRSGGRTGRHQTHLDDGAVVLQVQHLCVAEPVHLRQRQRSFACTNESRQSMIESTFRQVRACACAWVQCECESEGEPV